MNTRKSFFDKVCFLYSITSNKFTNLTQSLHFNPFFSFKVKKLVPIFLILFLAQYQFRFQFYLILLCRFSQCIQQPHNLFLYRERGERDFYIT